MKLGGQTIANYFARNFEFLEDLFKFSKKDNFFITNQILYNRCVAAGINITDLENYKVITQLNDGNYEINKRFADFIAFLIDDFRLELPDTIRKYQISIENLFSQITLDNLTLNDKKTKHQIVELINALINEIQEFSLQVHSNSNELQEQTSRIRTNHEKLDYVDKIRKASNLIEDYIKPLNDILTREHTHSFISLLLKISEFANLHRHEQYDTALKSNFDKLYQHLLHTNDDILKNSSMMAKDVTPLIHRLNTENMILKGVEHFLLSAKKGTISTTTKLYEIKGNYNKYIYNKNFYTSAKHLMELVQKQETVFIKSDHSDTNEVREQWIFDKDNYRDKLIHSMPIDNFFEWCFRTLRKDTKYVNAEKFYYVSSLLFEKDIHASFEINKKVSIELDDYVLQVPMVSVKQQ